MKVLIYYYSTCGNVLPQFNQMDRLTSLRLKGVLR